MVDCLGVVVQEVPEDQLPDVVVYIGHAQKTPGFL